MKILVISQHYYPENFRITDICETLVKKGHIVEVICGLPNYPEGKILEEYKHKKHNEEILNRVKIHRCFEIGRGNNKIKLFLNYYSICLSMRKKAKRLKEKFDIVFINQLSPVMVSWAGIAYAKKHKIPAVLYCYDLWPASLAAGGINNNSFIYKYFYKVSNKCYKNVDKICVTSKMFLDYFINVHKINENKLIYLPQYCEDIYKDTQKTNLKDEKIKNFVFAGNIGKMQSVETIIKAANEIKDNKSIKIHIVGSGSNLKNCQELAKKYNLKNVIFYGRKSLEEMPKYYDIADAMIVTLTKNELISKTLPGKVQSYMSYGKSIIGSIDGECQNIIKESNCGVFCEAENYKKLANLFLNFDLLKKDEYEKNSINFYNKNFKKEIFFNSLESLLYKELQNKKNSEEKI